MPLIGGVVTAIGFNLQWMDFLSYGSEVYERFTPEAVAYAYSPVGDDYFLRAGARIGYSNLQPDMPQSVKVEESDIYGAAEMGLLRDGLLIPTFTVGTGLLRRKVSQEIADPIIITGSNPLSQIQIFPFLYSTVGLGLPFFNGRIVAEMMYRYLWVPQDARMGNAYGVEVTVEL